MKQILLLEKSDLDKLKSGETLTLNLPSGETVQLGLEAGRGSYKKKEPNYPVGESLRERSYGATDAIYNFLSKNKGKFFTSTEIKEKLSLRPPQFYGTIKGLHKTGHVTRKVSKELGAHRRNLMSYAWTGNVKS